MEGSSLPAFELDKNADPPRPLEKASVQPSDFVLFSSKELPTVTRLDALDSLVFLNENGLNKSKRSYC